MIPVVRVIARLNIGGPAIQAITLTRELEPHGYATTLVRGVEGPEEGTMDPLAERLGVTPVRIDALRRDPGRHDAAALGALIALLRRTRPRLVHTHAAKAGTLGRLAVRLAFPAGRRPIVVHTFHGHSLTGYFSARTSARYTRIEQGLARVSDRLVAVSPEVRDELVALRVAPPERFSVIPLGLDLAAFNPPDAERARVRARVRSELDLGDAPVVTLVARLVPIKRVDRFLAAAARVATRHPAARFVIVGDGELNAPLRGSEAARTLGPRLTFTGFRSDIPALCFASDVIVLNSDNEGTPVSLIEAQAAGVPVVCTRVGGAATVVRHGETGLLTDLSSEAVAHAITAILGDPSRAAAFGEAGRRHALGAFSLPRLVGDIAALYAELGVSPIAASV